MATQAVMEREAWSHGGKTSSRYVSGNADGYSIRNSVRKGKTSTGHVHHPLCQSAVTGWNKCCYPQYHLREDAPCVSKIDWLIMLGLTGTLNYYLFNGSIDMRKGVYGLSDVVRHEMKQNPNNPNNVYIFMSKNRRIIKILHYERGFYVLYEKRPLMGKFKKPIYDDKTKSYQINWNDMVYLTESLVISQISIPKAR